MCRRYTNKLQKNVGINQADLAPGLPQAQEAGDINQTKMARYNLGPPQL